MRRSSADRTDEATFASPIQESLLGTVMTEHGHHVEELFARLFGNTFLKGFVYHSPKFFAPTEQEAGDIVIWCRRFLVAVEVLARNPIAGRTTKQFVQRIGEKRQQLVKDHELYCGEKHEIELVNGFGYRVPYDKSNVLPINFSGIVLVAASEDLEKLHFESMKKAVDADFPIAIMRTRDLEALLAEVNTIPDLVYYLKDRTRFLREVYEHSPKPFLDLNRRTESELIAFYKLHENSFPAQHWQETEMHTYPERYLESWSEKRSQRDAENTSTYVIDRIIEFIVGANREYPGAMFHAWELGQLSRRERAAGLSERMLDAFSKISTRETIRYFAWFSQSTSCWSVFCFGRGSREEFAAEVRRLCYLKLILEVAANQFKYSVFGFGFFKSQIETGTTFDFLTLEIADAAIHQPPNEADMVEARAHFDPKAPRVRIHEFPDS